MFGRNLLLLQTSRARTFALSLGRPRRCRPLLPCHSRYPSICLSALTLIGLIGMHCCSVSLTPSLVVVAALNSSSSWPAPSAERHVESRCQPAGNYRPALSTLVVDGEHREIRSESAWWTWLFWRVLGRRCRPQPGKQCHVDVGAGESLPRSFGLLRRVNGERHGMRPPGVSMRCKYLVCLPPIGCESMKQVNNKLY